MTTSPQEVKSQLVGDDGWPRSTPVSRSIILSWMTDPSLEVRGVVYHFLRERPDLCRIDAPLPDHDVYRFIIRYFEDCLATPRWDGEDGMPEWILTAVDLSHAIAYWARDHWRDHQSEAARSELLEWLRSALLRFPHYQELLATALEDHFFDRKIRKHAAHWTTDPLLARLLPELANQNAPTESRPNRKNSAAAKKRRR
jgi:hypothetical protein